MRAVDLFRMMLTLTKQQLTEWEKKDLFGRYGTVWACLHWHLCGYAGVCPTRVGMRVA
jgi:hypothetical protein